MFRKGSKLLSLLLVLVMLIGIIPTAAFAAGSIHALALDEEQNFTISDPGDSEKFQFTAPEDGTYILYFKNISQLPISLAFPDGSTEYRSCQDCDFQGHMKELTAGESVSITFDHPKNGGMLGEYSGYSGTVGVRKKADESDFTGFHAAGVSADAPCISIPLQNNSVVQFCADDPFCCGITWDIRVADEGILSWDTDSSESGTVTCDAAFVPHAVGKTSVTVRATYGSTTKENTYTVQVVDDSGEGSPHEFSSFDELKQLLSSGEELFDLCYIGTGELVISEDICIPENVFLYLQGKDLQIAADAVLTLAEAAHVFCGSLSVNGFLSCADQATIVLTYPAEIQGLDHIEFANEWQQIEIHANADADSLAGCLTQMSTQYIDDPHVRYQIFVSAPENPDTALTLKQDITIPAHVNVTFSELASFTVAEGVTITSAGNMDIWVPFILNGTLENTGSLCINNDDWASGSITAGNTGSLSGNGEFLITAKAGSQLSDLVKGVDLADYDIVSETRPDGTLFWSLKFADGLIKLGTPTDLSWGTRYDYTIDYDENTGAEIITGCTQTPQPGMMSWKTVRPDQAQFQVKIYDATNGCLVQSAEARSDPALIPDIRSEDFFTVSDLDSGTYYFTVQSLGDYENYRNSDVAVSGTYTYVKPSARLGTCTGLRWEDKNDQFVSWAQYTLPADVTKAGFEMEFFFSPTENGEYEPFGGISATSADGLPDPEEPLHDEFLQQRGVGYYKFRVRLLSLDIETVCNGAWSDFSPALDVKTIPNNVDRDLDTILSNAGSFTPNDIRSAVQSMNTTDLKTALLTDQSNTGTTAKLADLEDKAAGGPANVMVTAGVSAFPQNKVSVVGANLNTNTSASDPITLVIDKPNSDHVIPELYDSAVAVKFSMTLRNVPDPENLEVPVKISLPVPDNINPDFLVIFHYHADGSYELLHPYVYEKSGTYYADFVLTSFSDFAMTQLRTYAYDMTAGSGQTYQKGSSTALTFCSAADIDKFVSVSIDHNPLAPEYYTVEASDSGTAVTLKPAFLATLGSGEHVITIISSDGEAETTFTVRKSGDSNQNTSGGTNAGVIKSSDTGDGSMLWMWYMLAACSLCGACGLIYSRKKHSAHAE